MHKPKRREAWTGEATVLANSMLALAQCWCVSCVSCVPLKLEAWSIDDGLVLNMPLFKASILTHFLLTSMWLFHVIYIFVPWYWYIKSAFDSGVQHRVQATSAEHLVFDPASNFRFFHPLSSPFFWLSGNWQIGKLNGSPSLLQRAKIIQNQDGLHVRLRAIREWEYHDAGKES